MSILAMVSLLAGVLVALVFLVGEGLDRAEKWVSIAGVISSLPLGAAGLMLAWLAWRRPRRVAAAASASESSNLASFAPAEPAGANAGGCSTG